MVYNVHSLIHLTADVDRFGPLDAFSAFKYENFLGIRIIPKKNTEVYKTLQ